MKKIEFYQNNLVIDGERIDMWPVRVRILQLLWDSYQTRVNSDTPNIAQTSLTHRQITTIIYQTPVTEPKDSSIVKSDIHNLTNQISFINKAIKPYGLIIRCTLSNKTNPGKYYLDCLVTKNFPRFELEFVDDAVYVRNEKVSDKLLTPYLILYLILKNVDGHLENGERSLLIPYYCLLESLGKRLPESENIIDKDYRILRWWVSDLRKILSELKIPLSLKSARKIGILALWE